MVLPLAFPTRADAAGVELRVNFGVFAGREATPAEIDVLAQALVADIPFVSIVSEQRHEVSEDSEVSLHQVRIEVPEDALPSGADDVDSLVSTLVARAESWARACIAERHAGVTDALDA